MSLKTYLVGSALALATIYGCSNNKLKTNNQNPEQILKETISYAPAMPDGKVAIPTYIEPVYPRAVDSMIAELNKSMLVEKAKNANDTIWNALTLSPASKSKDTLTYIAEGVAPNGDDVSRIVKITKKELEHLAKKAVIK